MHAAAPGLERMPATAGHCLPPQQCSADQYTWEGCSWACICTVAPAGLRRNAIGLQGCTCSTGPWTTVSRRYMQCMWQYLASAFAWWPLHRKVLQHFLWWRQHVLNCARKGIHPLADDGWGIPLTVLLCWAGTCCLWLRDIARVRPQRRLCCTLPCT